MPKSFSKVHKKISKKRGAVEALHENSRDVKRLNRANTRDTRVARVQATTSRGRQSYLDRIAYFQEGIPEESSTVSNDDIREMVTRYINRDIPEIEQLQHERRKGRPPAKREEVLLQRTETENKELKTGFWLPDVTNEDVVAALRRWNGDWSSLSTMKFIRITSDGGKQ
ncbi:translation machinery-associated protein 16, partial [Elasticomyces elasticus]